MPRRKPIETIQLYGTELIGPVDGINNSPEHTRVGLRWEFSGSMLDIEREPYERANLANYLGLFEEVAAQLNEGGVDIKWPLINGSYLYFSIRKGKVRKLTRWPK